MKNQKHTPGPWTTEDCTDGIAIESGGKYIADVHYHIAGAMSAQETQANAALIAAAPEMLEVLEMLLAHRGMMGSDSWAVAEKMIKKAKGL